MKNKSKIQVTFVSQRHSDTFTIPIYRMKSIYGQLKIQIPFADVPVSREFNKYCSFVSQSRLNSEITEITVVLGDDITILIESI